MFFRYLQGILTRLADFRPFLTLVNFYQKIGFLAIFVLSRTQFRIFEKFLNFASKWIFVEFSRNMLSWCLRVHSCDWWVKNDIVPLNLFIYPLSHAHMGFWGYYKYISVILEYLYTIEWMNENNLYKVCIFWKPIMSARL